MSICFLLSAPISPSLERLEGSPALQKGNEGRLTFAVCLGGTARYDSRPRDVAQFGSALVWGTRGRRFKSGRPDWLRVKGYGS